MKSFGHDAVCLQLPKLLDQHLLADPLDFSPQLSEPPWLR